MSRWQRMWCEIREEYEYRSPWIHLLWLLWFVIIAVVLIAANCKTAHAQKPTKHSQADSVCISNPERASELKQTKDTTYYIAQLNGADTTFAIPNKRRWMPIIDESYFLVWKTQDKKRKFDGIHKLRFGKSCPLFRRATNNLGGFL